MKETLKVLNDMVAKGAIERYAVGGPVGAMFYMQVYCNADLDILILPKMIKNVPHLGLMYDYFQKKVYQNRHGWMIINGVPVDFIPVWDDLSKEAVENSIEKIYAGVPAKVLRPEYIVAIGLKTRGIEFSMFLDRAPLKPVETKLLQDIFKRHDLFPVWEKDMKRISDHWRKGYEKRFLGRRWKNKEKKSENDRVSSGFSPMMYKANLRQNEEEAKEPIEQKIQVLLGMQEFGMMAASAKIKQRKFEHPWSKLGDVLPWRIRKAGKKRK